MRRDEALERLPKDIVTPISPNMDMVKRGHIYNYSKSPDCSGTLSPAALQTIMEYTTRPGNVVATLNAQFGAIYEAAENCGRLVFGSEDVDHFGSHARKTIKSLVPKIPRQPSTFELLVNSIFDKNADQNEVLANIPDHPLTRAKLSCLEGEEWLRDDVMDAYMALLQERGSPVANVRLKFFPTHFYQLISKSKYDVRAGMHYVKEQNLLDWDFLYIPINLRGVHWVMVGVDLRICAIWGIDPLPTKEDSLADEMYIIARFFDDLAKIRRKAGQEPVSILSWRRAMMEKVPTQQDGYNCGVYVLMFAELMSRPTYLVIDHATLPDMRKRIAVDLVTKKICRD